jgi:hypothetical protein
MTADRWTHHDPAVRKLIREAQAEAWDAGADSVCPNPDLCSCDGIDADPTHDQPPRNPYRRTCEAWAGSLYVGPVRCIKPRGHEGEHGDGAGGTWSITWAPAPTEDANDYDGAAADRRAMYDPESGRIDNWSER